jgi:hypothetical protein
VPELNSDVARAKEYNSFANTSLFREEPEGYMGETINWARGWGVAVLVAVVALLVYVRTLAPGVLPGDSAEFQTAAWNFTIVHPTGYPLYLLLGGLWDRLIPLEDPAYRLNLFSAVWSALTVGLVYLIVWRLTRRIGAAIVAAAALGVSATFWSQATEAEVYAFNSFFAALLVWLALRAEEKQRWRDLALWTFAFGLALTHHRTIILLIPGLFVWFVGNRFKRRNEKTQTYQYLLPILLFLAPFLLYAYIPLRLPATPYARFDISPTQTITVFDDSPRGLINYVLGRTFQSDIGWSVESLTRLESVGKRFVDEFNYFGIAFGFIGLLALLLRNKWGFTIFSALGIATVVGFNAIYHIGDIADFYTPAYLLFSLWIGLGIAQIGDWLVAPSLHLFDAEKQGTAFVRLVALFAFALVPLSNIEPHFARADRTTKTHWRDRWEEILAAPLPQDAILISNDRDEIAPLYYFQYVENRRSDLIGLFPLITTAPEHANVARLTQSVLGSGRDVFLIKEMPGIDVRFLIEAAEAGMTRVVDDNVGGPTVPAESDTTLAGRVRATGFTIVGNSARAGEVMPILIYWQVILPLEKNYTTFVQLFDEGDEKVAEGNDHKAGGDFYPTTLWQIGETVADHFDVPLPEGLEPGEYRVMVGMYAGEGLEMLGEAVEVGRVEVK